MSVYIISCQQLSQNSSQQLWDESSVSANSLDERTESAKAGAWTSAQSLPKVVPSCGCACASFPSNSFVKTTVRTNAKQTYGIYSD
jgi:hypothetical protein